ncbi:R3H domain-containing protein 1 [Selaginella moellendorffii]|uniref:R3H domain-containing protein 1 n=1 Tax=Selaginella moellendorffii TaxID=88036 RepID=UPI000D1CD9A5|nr:R3H domain-containing protein 1 [Selaginella moellendorffii]|eukprot:XP_024517311.1 R3H domain-containing protein 1 [Selaginella moellendorffii]
MEVSANACPNASDLQVEELASLVRNNLHTKHLLLAAEEAFVEFLDPSSDRELLELTPMVSYHRMLLHRLADVYGLAHESVGEGDGRHLVVAKCEDSSIPSVLLSDLLNAFEDSCSIASSSSRTLLKRSAMQASEKQFTSNENPVVTSLEEREAAYLSARERIFSSCETSTSTVASDEAGDSNVRSPRTVPAVAHRMITHALGKSSAQRRPEQHTSRSPEKPPDQDGSTGETCSRTRNARRPDMPGRAASRLLSKALGIQEGKKR